MLRRNIFCEVNGCVLLSYWVSWTVDKELEATRRGEGRLGFEWRESEGRECLRDKRVQWPAVGERVRSERSCSTSLLVHVSTVKCEGDGFRSQRVVLKGPL